MAEETAPTEEPKEEKTSKTTLIAVLLIAAGALVVLFSQLNTQNYTYNTEVAGVAVHSQIPLSDIQNINNIALYNNTDKAALTCNFEIAALTTRDATGYKVLVERGDAGLFILKNRAYIRGKTDDDIIRACNIFSCLQQGINCSSGIWDIRNLILEKKQINVILDKNLRGSAMRAYGDVLGALGYIQASNIVLADVNNDSKVDKKDIEASLIKIFPHIKDGNSCALQPITTQYQRLNETNNETFDCDKLWPAIVLKKSNTSRIDYAGGQLIISGNDESVGAGAIIVRDALSPEFIRKYYNLD
jgi:hypothetical protein